MIEKKTTQEFNMVKHTMCIPMSTTTLGSIIFIYLKFLKCVAYIAAQKTISLNII